MILNSLLNAHSLSAAGAVLVIVFIALGSVGIKSALRRHIKAG